VPTLVETHSATDQVIHQKEGQAFNFQELVARFKRDIFTDFLFVKSSQSLTGDTSADKACKEFNHPSGIFIAVEILTWLELLPAYRRLLSVVDGMKAFIRS
jgi:hypothetical protein